MTIDTARLRALAAKLDALFETGPARALTTPEWEVWAAVVDEAQDAWREATDTATVLALLAERDAMERERDEARARAEVAQAGFAAAVGKAQWQAVTNRELNEARDAIDGLRADATRATNQALEELARADALKAERDALAALLRETLQPGAYGIGSTLAQRISAALDGAKGNA